MNKYFLIAFLLLITGAVSAQKKNSVLHLIRSESSHGMKKNGVDLLIAYKAVFQQDNSVLSSDSAYFYQAQNAFDAFGHVLITQGDTLNIYSDKLNYNGNTKIAILTDNVRMIDKDAVLTTNYLTYSTATKIGTYTGGGKLVNKTNTLVSKNGYYFAGSRDAYFRYDVVLTTVDAVIKTDTLRYNSGSRIAFFYGPTNIYGKDKDTLYTENGTYNTITEQAAFGKKNAYKKGTKTLKGDSLFYDRLVGYGRAVKHVTFTDTEQKVMLHGDLGETFKVGDRTLMTEHPYVVFVTEEKDTTKTDSVKNKPLSATAKKSVLLTPPKNTMPVIDSAKLAAMAKKPILTPPKNTMPIVDSAKLTAKVKKLILTPPKNTMPIVDSVKLKTGKAIKNLEVRTIKPVDKKDTVRIKRDSIFMTADTIETQILTYKDLKEIKDRRRQELLAKLDTTIKLANIIVFTKPVKFIEIVPLRLPSDTTIFHQDYFKKKVAPKDTSQHKALPATVVKKTSRPALPTVKKINSVLDSVNLTQTITLSDTARVRILIAAHHAKIFKSDLQAKADSIFFSYSDSVARMYVHPMIWAEGSQLSGDTIHLQLKKKQFDNIELFPSAFIVNIEKQDSTHFNQVGGRKMRGFFKDGKLDRMFVDGNAETIYFARDSLKVTEMHRTISSRIRVNFKKNEAMNITWFVKPDARYLGIAKVKDDDKILKGFLWKPKDRPVSKESIINPPKAAKTTAKKPAAKKQGPNDKAGASLTPNIKTASDSLKTKLDTLKMKIDTSKLKIDVSKPVKAKTDTTKVKTDTTKIKLQ